MRRSSAGLFVGILLLLAGRAFADVMPITPITGEQVVLNVAPDGGVNSGGPFIGTLYPASGPSQSWTTFCVQADGYDVTFNPGQTYYVGNTDLNFASNGNYVTDAAKWLYYESQAAPSAIPGYIPGTLPSDSDLQEAIWLEVQGGGVGGPNLGSAGTQDANTAAWVAAANTAVSNGWAEADQVQVLWLVDGSNNPAQNQLYVTAPTIPVPEPSTLVLLGFGAVSFLFWRRRR